MRKLEIINRLLREGHITQQEAAILMSNDTSEGKNSGKQLLNG